MHVQDVLRLHVRELEGRRHQLVPGLSPTVRLADRGDDGVDHVQGLDEPFDDVGPRPSPPEAVLAAPAHDVDLVGYVRLEGGLQRERPRDPMHQGHHVDAEARLQRRQLEQVVQYNVGVGVPFEGDDDLRVVARRQVLDVPDALQFPAVDQFGDAFLDSA